MVGDTLTSLLLMVSSVSRISNITKEKEKLQEEQTRLVTSRLALCCFVDLDRYMVGDIIRGHMYEVIILSKVKGKHPVSMFRPPTPDITVCYFTTGHLCHCFITMNQG